MRTTTREETLTQTITETEHEVVKTVRKIMDKIDEISKKIQNFNPPYYCPHYNPFYCHEGTELANTHKSSRCVSDRAHCDKPWQVVRQLLTNVNPSTSRCSSTGKGEQCKKDDNESLECTQDRPVLCPQNSEFRKNPRGNKYPCVKTPNECNMPWEIVDLNRNYGTVSSMQTNIRNGGKISKKIRKYKSKSKKIRKYKSKSKKNRKTNRQKMQSKKYKNSIYRKK
jgi:hypothetical protein